MDSLVRNMIDFRQVRRNLVRFVAPSVRSEMSKSRMNVRHD